MQSLTSYQVNRNSVKRQVIRRVTAKAAGMNHSQTIKSTRPKQKERYDTRFNWIWHEITYILTNKIKVKGLYERAWLVLKLNHLHPKKKVGSENQDKEQHDQE